MPCGILQLVANSGAAQNLWIDHDPEITYFKKYIVDIHLLQENLFLLNSNPKLILEDRV